MAAWRSVHVYYYARDKDALILDGIRPLWMSLVDRPGVEGAYFVRHWLRGPHVRVHVKVTDEAWERHVRPLIESVMGGYLREHPSTGAVTETEELPAHRRLAQLEQEHGPLEPWYPDNSLQFLPHDPRLHVLGTPESAELLADFHTRTTPLAFAVLDEVRRGANRMDVPLRLMFATAAHGCPPIDKGFLSYRSHVEGFLANSSDPDGFRARFERAFRSNAAALAQRMEEGLAGTAPHLAEWITIVDAYKRRIGDLHDTGRLPLAAIETPADAGAADSAGTGSGVTVSAFHRALFGNDEIRNQLNTADWFAVYRVLLNYQYLLFNRLGLVPVERFMLCYLAARTVETAYSISIPEFLQPGRLLAPS